MLVLDYFVNLPFCQMTRLFSMDQVLALFSETAQSELSDPQGLS